MESVHGVDVSWLHRSKSEVGNSPKKSAPQQRPATARQGASYNGNRHSLAVFPQEGRPSSERRESIRTPAPAITSVQTPSEQKQRRSSLFRSTSSKDDKSKGDKQAKRNSWMSSLSSKLSSQNSRVAAANTVDNSKITASDNETTAAAPEPIKDLKEAEEATDTVGGLLAGSPSKNRDSFLSSAFRRLSTASVAKSGSQAPRQVLNVDAGRERCPVPELDDSDLRRVAFSVDVEIAGTSRYGPGEDNGSDKRRKLKDKKKLKDKDEGAALKNPEKAAAIKEADSSDEEESNDAPTTPGPDAASTSNASPDHPASKATENKAHSKHLDIAAAEKDKDSDASWDDGWNSPADLKKKLSKSKSSEKKKVESSKAEHKTKGDAWDDGWSSGPDTNSKSRQKKEGKASSLPKVKTKTPPEHRAAAPAQAVSPGPPTPPPCDAGPPASASSGETAPNDILAPPTEARPVSGVPPQPDAVTQLQQQKHHHSSSRRGSQAPPRSQDKPTVDPLRMYRRCCQLREAPVLKRISEQLQKMQHSAIEVPGVVHCLDLRKSRMQLPDIVCLGDWLAIVPVKKLLLEDANLTDEGVRVVLAGLLAVKPPGLVKRKRGKSSPHRIRDSTIFRTPGVIEKVSLKNNPKLTAEGWKHICQFLNMSKSLKAIDISMIPMPQAFQLSPVNSAGDTKLQASKQPHEQKCNMIELITKSVRQRLGNDLEELILADCSLGGYEIGAIVDSAIECKIHILGLASNNINLDGLEHVARFLKSGECHALDIGGTDLSENFNIVMDALPSASRLWALSLANCNLDATSIAELMPKLAALPDFRFLDLSHHRDLFSRRRGTLRLLRQYLPQIRMLKRLHLLDVAMTPAQAIGLAEILPECANLAHINLLENTPLTALAGPANETDQEEACAFYASFMTAVRLSKTMIAVDVDVPGPESSEIVKALARQVVAYCLRNLERYAELGALAASDAASALPDIPDKDKDVAMPELLNQLLNQLDGQSTAENKKGTQKASSKDDKTLDDDYFVGATGLVKALSYFLNASDMRRLSVIENSSTTATPDNGQSKAKDVSKTLLSSARDIRARLQPLIARESLQATDDLTLRRLTFFDHTLGGMIDRFEQEYPETRVSGDNAGDQDLKQVDSAESTEPIEPNPILVDDTFFPSGGMTHSNDPCEETTLRRNSTSARDLTLEEGDMHRLGQRLRRNVFPPKGTLDHLHGTSPSDPEEPAYVTALREKIEEVAGEDMQARVRQYGIDSVIAEYVSDRDQLERMQREAPAEFEQWRLHVAERNREEQERRQVGQKGRTSPSDAEGEESEASSKYGASYGSK